MTMFSKKWNKCSRRPFFLDNYRSPSSGDPNRELVLEVVQDQYIKFCKKVALKTFFFVLEESLGKYFEM